MDKKIFIQILIQLLRQDWQTIDSIQKQLEKQITPRQIRTAIEKITSKIADNETIRIAAGRHNRRAWKVETIEKTLVQIQTEEYDALTRRLARAVMPQVFSSIRQESLNKLMPLIEDSIRATHFYEHEAHEKMDQNLEKLVRAIDKSAKIRILAIHGDATSAKRLVNLPTLILPTQVIYHRGCFYLAAVDEPTKRVVTFQVDQLDIEETHESFTDKEQVRNQVENDLKRRFGITQNIDDNVYTIRLRFSNTTGAFSKGQFWHNEEGVEKSENEDDSHILTCQCGINRELVGWIFQWMNNVKVLDPPQLVDLYNEQLARIEQVSRQSPDASLPYTNAFAPT